MADTVATQTLHNGERYLVQKFTSASDGTGESAVVKVDVSALGCVRVALQRVEFSTAGMSVNMLWDATTPVLLQTLQSDRTEVIDYKTPLQNPKATGWTGDIKFTTAGHSSGDTYAVTLHMKKQYS
jgi:hypothetical protein